MLQTASFDADGVPHGLADGFFANQSFKKMMGLGRDYKRRLREIIDLACDQIRNENHTQLKKQKFLAAFDFAMELAKGIDRVKDSKPFKLFNNKLASDYLFDELNDCNVSFTESELDQYDARFSQRLMESSSSNHQLVHPLEHILKQQSFEDLSLVETQDQVKKALIWANENQLNESQWYKQLFERFPDHFLSYMAVDEFAYRYSPLLADVEVFDQTHAYQLKLLTVDQITESFDDTTKIKWDAIQWSASEINNIEISNPFESRYFCAAHEAIIDGLMDTNQRSLILKTVPAKLILALFKSNQKLKSNFGNEEDGGLPSASDGRQLSNAGPSPDGSLPPYSNGMLKDSSLLAHDGDRLIQDLDDSVENDLDSEISDTDLDSNVSYLDFSALDRFFDYFDFEKHPNDYIEFLKLALIYQPDLAVDLIHSNQLMTYFNNQLNDS